MRSWKPQPSGLLWIAMVTLVAAVGGVAYFLAQLATLAGQPPAAWPISGALFGRLLACIALLALTGALIYRVAATLTLTYSMDRNGLYINWLDNRVVVPLQQIERIERGLATPVRLIDRLRSFGYHHGRARLPDGRTAHRFSTAPLGETLVVHTQGAAYAISPQDSDGFVQDLEQRRRLGAVQQLTAGVEARGVFSSPFWDDRVVRPALLLALLLNLALLGWLMMIVPGLPALIDLRADAAGAAATFAPRHQILFLPLAGAVLTLLNMGLGLGFYRREPAGAQLLQVTSVGLQLLFAVAALSILR